MEEQHKNWKATLNKILVFPKPQKWMFDMGV